MTRTVYVDTSVIGGVFDDEFKLWTNLFFKELNRGLHRIAISDLLVNELEGAPLQVKNYLNKIADKHCIEVIFNQSN